MRLRKDVNIFIHHPSSKFFHVVVELKDTPGALHGILGILRDLNLNVLGSFSSVDSDARTGVWSGFVEDSHHTASELKERISSSEDVLDSIVVESKEGFLVDGVHFPLAFNTGDKAMMMRTKYFGGMLAAVRKEFGTGGNVILYDEGLTYGKDVWANYLATLGAGFMRSNLQEVLKLYQALGWFKLEGVDQDERDGAITIRTSGSFECEGIKSKGPNSHFVKGHLCGGFTVIMDREMTCEEKKCIAAGDQHCEFVLRPKEAVGRRAEPMRALLTAS